MATVKIIDWPDIIVTQNDYTKGVNIDDENGNLDITNWTLRFTVKQNEGDTDGNALIGPVTLTKTDASAGESELSLTDTETDITAGTHFYSLKADKDGGEKQTFMKGEIEFKESVTDA